MSMKSSDVLKHRVTPPLMDEAPSSWMSRLALDQGCSIGEMLEFLGQSFDSDVDAALHGPRLAELRRKCDLPPTAFALADRMMGRVAAAALGRHVLYRCGPRVPRFLFCPLCLRERQPRTLKIFWRFMDWRHCPIHSCLTETNCWNCGNHLWYPRDMAKSKAGQTGHASPHRCQYCCADLSEAVPFFIELNTRKCLSTLEGKWLWTGHQIVLTLARPNPVDSEVFRPQHTLPIERLPSANEWLKVARLVRERSSPNVSESQANRCWYKAPRKNWGRSLLFTSTLNEGGYFEV